MIPLHEHARVIEAFEAAMFWPACPVLISSLQVLQTLLVVQIKPDGVQRALVGEIVSRFEEKGFTLKGLKMFVPSKDLAEEHYKDLSSKPFFKDLVSYITSGPVVAMVGFVPSQTMWRASVLSAFLAAFAAYDDALCNVLSSGIIEMLRAGFKTKDLKAKTHAKAKELLFLEGLWSCVHSNICMPSSKCNAGYCGAKKFEAIKLDESVSAVAYLRLGSLQVWEGDGVVASARKLIGATNPLNAEPGTIRGDFAGA